MSFLVRSYLALALALAILFPLSSQSAEPTPVQGQMMAEGKTRMDGKMMERCQAMIEQKQKIMAEMKAQDVELGEMVSKMNSAPDDKKMALMAAIVTRLVEQRAAMHEQMGKMGNEMMTQMMQCMPKGNDSMSACPMMSGSDEKSADTPKKEAK